MYYKFELDLVLLNQPRNSGSRVLTHDNSKTLCRCSVSVISDSLWSHVHGVLELRILEWFAIPSSSGPRVVRTLHYDLSIFSGTAWLIASLSYINHLAMTRLWSTKGLKLLHLPKDLVLLDFFFFILITCLRSEFLSLHTTDIWVKRPFVGSGPGYCMIFSSILDLTPQDANSPLSSSHFLLTPTPQICSHLAVTTKHVSRQYRYIPWQESQPWLKVTVLVYSVWCSVMGKWDEMEDWDWHIYTAAAKSLQLCPTLCNPIDGSHQAPPSLGFSRQEYWSGLPFPSPMHESEKWKWSRSVMSDS